MPSGEAHPPEMTLEEIEMTLMERAAEWSNQTPPATIALAAAAIDYTRGAAFSFRPRRFHLPAAARARS